MEALTHGGVLARFGHALSDPTRARLLLALREAPAYPADLADPDTCAVADKASGR